MTKHLILGCGPAGLLAAHACLMMGDDFVIISKKRKSHMYGAQYLHEPIPGIPGIRETARVIRYDMAEGDVDGYRGKVYGPLAVKTSPEDLAPKHTAYDIRKAYDWLWDKYRSSVIDGKFTHRGEQALSELKLLQEKLHIDGITISTIPRTIFFSDDQFITAKVYALGDAPDRGQLVPGMDGFPDFTVSLNGDPDYAWYRKAKVFGHSTMEWSGKRKPPYEGIVEVLKPISTTSVFPSNVFGLGRYGSWTKGVLSHEAFFDTSQLIALHALGGAQ